MSQNIINHHYFCRNELGMKQIKQWISNILKIKCHWKKSWEKIPYWLARIFIFNFIKRICFNWKLYNNMYFYERNYQNSPFLSLFRLSSSVWHFVSCPSVHFDEAKNQWGRFNYVFVFESLFRLFIFSCSCHPQKVVNKIFYLAVHTYRIFEHLLKINSLYLHTYWNISNMNK